MRGMKTTLVAILALATLAAASLGTAAATTAPLVGHCAVVTPIIVAGHQLTDTYEVCVPV
jgi:hypothetical protein